MPQCRPHFGNARPGFFCDSKFDICKVMLLYARTGGILRLLIFKVSKSDIFKVSKSDIFKVSKSDIFKVSKSDIFKVSKSDIF